MPEFNDFIFGLRKKEFVVIGARTSEGKSTFASQLAFDFASQGKMVLFLSLEMTVEKIVARMFCYQQRFDNAKVFRGGVKLRPTAVDAFEAAVKGLPMVITDMLGKNWQDIDELIGSTDLKPAVVILDYIQTIARDDKKSRLDEINEYIRHFREMCIRRNFCGILCSQINRTGQETNDKRPQAHQLKSSGFLEEHADVVILLSWPHKYGHKNINKFTAFVAKNKDGQTGYIDLKFEPQFYAFSDADKKELSENVKEDVHWQD